MSNTMDTDNIPHGHLLTLVDVLKSHFHPEVATHPQTGQVTYPRKEYLSAVAAEKKRQLDEAARSGSGG